MITQMKSIKREHTGDNFWDRETALYATGMIVTWLYSQKYKIKGVNFNISKVNKNKLKEMI